MLFHFHDVSQSLCFVFWLSCWYEKSVDFNFRTDSWRAEGKVSILWRQLGSHCWGTDQRVIPLSTDFAFIPIGLSFIRMWHLRWEWLVVSAASSGLCWLSWQWLIDRFSDGILIKWWLIDVVMIDWLILCWFIDLIITDWLIKWWLIDWFSDDLLIKWWFID